MRNLAFMDCGEDMFLRPSHGVRIEYGQQMIGRSSFGQRTQEIGGIDRSVIYLRIKQGTQCTWIAWQDADERVGSAWTACTSSHVEHGHIGLPRGM